MISVVIPLYNKEKSIKNTLESVLAQTHTDFECIIINDGSTDRSEDVVFDIVSNDSRFKLIRQAKGGVSRARNRGILEAKGDFIAFLDGDDLWDNTYLEELQQLIIDYPNAAIYGLGYSEIVNGIKPIQVNNVPIGFRGILPDIWKKYSRTYWTSATACPTRKAQKTLFDEHLTHGEDLDVWYRLMLQGDAVYYNKTLAYYVKDAENRAMNRIPNINNHIVSVIPRYKEAREANAAFRKAFDTQMAYFLYEYMFTEYKNEAKHFAKLLDYSQLKKSIWFRLKFPHLYRFLRK